MTFLYDEKILAEFSNILKQGQQTLSLGDVAKKLVNNLESELMPTDKPNDPLSGHEHGFEITYDNLANLATLLSHSIENSLKFDNTVLVNSNKEDPERVEVIVKKTPVYVHREAFGNYLKYLAEQARQTKDKVLASLVNNIINESKNIANIDKVNVHYDDELHEGSKLLNVNLNLLDSDSVGEKELTIGDLKDKLKFNEWVKKSVKNIENAYANLSKFFTHLKNIFENSINRADTKYVEDLFTNALNRLNNLAKSFNVSFTSSESKSNSSEPSEQESSLIITNVINTLPLKVENISKDRIDRFYQNLTKLSGYDSFKSTTDRYLQEAQALIGLDIFPITSSYAQVYNSLQNPHPNTFFKYTQTLQQILDSVYNAINTFRSKSEDKYPEGTNINKINFQIGENESDQSIYRMNTNSIKNLENKFRANFKKV